MSEYFFYFGGVVFIALLQSLSSSALSFASPSFDFSGDEVTVMGLAENSIDAMAGIRAKGTVYRLSFHRCVLYWEIAESSNPYIK